MRKRATSFDITASPYSFGEIKAKADELGRKSGLTISLQRNEIFDEMHSV